MLKKGRFAQQGCPEGQPLKMTLSDRQSEAVKANPYYFQY